VDVDAEDENGETALVIAAKEGKSKHVKMLMANKAHLDVKSKDGVPAIEIIAEKIPSAIDEFTQRLDSGVSFGQKNDGIARLDFRKLFTTRWKDQTSHFGDMEFFFGIINSPFKTKLEHPLLWAFLNMKLVQVKKFYYFMILCHLVFSFVLSIYCGLVFSRLCPPGEEANLEKRWEFTSTISCNLENISEGRKTAIFSCWIFLLVSLLIYSMRELMRMTTRPLTYFFWLKRGGKRGGADCYRNIAIIVFSALAVSRPIHLVPRAVELLVPRWTYYAASIACFFSWWEMMFMVGKIPKFGKYVHMFR
jgi:hypothetical protein